MSAKKSQGSSVRVSQLKDTEIRKKIWQGAEFIVTRNDTPTARIRHAVIGEAGIRVPISDFFKEMSVFCHKAMKGEVFVIQVHNKDSMTLMPLEPAKPEPPPVEETETEVEAAAETSEDGNDELKTAIVILTLAQDSRLGELVEILGVEKVRNCFDLLIELQESGELERAERVARALLE